MTGGETGVIGQVRKGCDRWGNRCDRSRAKRGVTGGETGVTGQVQKGV